jgi:hypothetical protein
MKGMDSPSTTRKLKDVKMEFLEHNTTIRVDVPKKHRPKLLHCYILVLVQDFMFYEVHAYQ